ncbi:MAG: glycine cleavage system protein GcvH [Zoogloeaceae bacterium]|jgi:glycine cleavage system H protein|nr:glycine cleavage system protein GcvH [Zoogloeaceae bacterium]
MIIPNELKYTATHEWARVEADGALTVGITDYAQEVLGDLVYVELPEIGRKLAERESCVALESVKAAAEAYAPTAGSVVAVNAAASAAPESVNQDAYAAWLFRLAPENAADVDKLLDADAYKALIDAEAATK